MSAALAQAALPASSALPGLSVARLSPVLGVEVSGVDLSAPFDDAGIAAIRALLLRHRVLVFRNQRIGPAAHVAFARRFGELEVHPIYENHPEHPELVMLRVDAERPGRENVFHSDTTFREQPAMGSILRCVSCPEIGGDTIWCNMVMAYERLPQHIKDLIADMRAVHDLLPSFYDRVPPEKMAETRRNLPPSEHPVVRTHPETGEKILYVNQTFTTHLATYNKPFGSMVGRERKLESDALLPYLSRQAEIPEYQVRIRWQPDTVVFWDNRSTQHYAVQDYFPASRLMQRATIVGDRPF